MSQGLSLDQSQQVHHIAQLALLAMCARGLAASEFDTNPEVIELRLTVRRPVGTELQSVDLEYIGTHDIPLGGMTI